MGNDPNAVSSVGELIQQLERELGNVSSEPPREVLALLQQFGPKIEKEIGENTGARMDFALALYEMGMEREAREQLHKIAVGDAGYFASRILESEMCVKLHRDDEAIQILEALTLDPHSPRDGLKDAGLRLVRLHLKRSQFGPLRVIVERLVADWPNDREVRELELLLKRNVGPISSREK